ncbi:DUF2252 domain-containing protein [Agromyces sp. NPDC058126]|uniref:DUF2252 domain-containing protein n=1 Tax=Agromyces sp. NPDC058126 TaxID=3346350 RepID=UPI0036DA8E55
MTLTRAEQFQDGRDRRHRMPRSAHGEWAPAKERADLVDVLTASDSGRLQELIPIRFARMAASPFAFFRGSAAVMASDLAHIPTTGLGVLLCGDCHLVNFGLFATPERNVVFGVNDFDETMPGPWEWDLKRLTASLVVACQDSGMDDHDAKSVAIAGAAAYRRRIAELATMTPLEVWYDRIDLARLIEEAPDKKTRKRRRKLRRKARRRVAENVFPKLVDTTAGGLRIADQPPLIFHLDDVTVESVQGFFSAYRSSLSRPLQVLFDRYTLRDVAIKVVGVGSVGTRCYVVLFTDDDGKPLLLQVKEANESVLAPYVPRRPDALTHHGQRVVTGQRLMQPASDIFLGYATSPAGRDFYVRQLRDMKLSVDLIADVGLMTRYAEFCAAALARAHANTGSAAGIAGYLGKSDTFDKALGRFSLAYAEQTVHDHHALVDAINAGRLEATLDTD